jgi:hypothetical protein
MAVCDYLVPFHPLSPSAYPPRADTLLGHLCHYLAQAEGESGVRRLLDAAATGAFRLSDPFPAGYLPFPTDNPETEAPIWKKAEEAFRQAAKKHLPKEDAGSHWHSLRKTARKIRFVAKAAWTPGLSRAQWVLDRVSGKRKTSDVLPAFTLQWEKGSVPALPWTAFHSLHTAVNRLTDGAETGALYERSGFACAPGTQLDLYLRSEESAAPAWLAALAEIGLTGHLKHASGGWGRFALGPSTKVSLPQSASAASRWVSLSSCVPETDYSGEVFGRLLTHYGRLGGNASEKVFKRPVVLLAAGATFVGSKPQGRMLTGVHERPEVVHCAWAYPIAG